MENILELSEDGKTIIGVKDKNVTLITIPKSITSIGDSAFSGCSSLQSVDIPNSVITIGNGAFYDCKSLQSIDIPNSVTTIGDRAFFGCSSLQSIDIPNSVTTIGNGEFSGCSSLQSINITKGNKHYESIDGILFSKDLTCILKLPEGKKLKEYTIPNSVTTIGKDAFDHCSSLQSIDIPNSVTTIGDYAFSGCSSLQSIDIPNSVTTIGNGAFYDCSSLQSIHLHWTNLLDIKISDTTLRYRTEDCTLYIPPGTRWEYRHHSIWGNFKNIEIEKQE